MADRRRMIHDQILESDDFNALTFRQQSGWFRLLLIADDQGRFKALTAWLRANIFPLCDLTIEDIETDLQAWVACGMVALYEVDGKRYGQIVNWWKYQALSWAQPSKYPAPPGWTDRVRYQAGGEIIKENWDKKEKRAASDDWRSADDSDEPPDEPTDPLPDEPSALPTALPTDNTSDVPSGIESRLESGLDKDDSPVGRSARANGRKSSSSEPETRKRQKVMLLRGMGVKGGKRFNEILDAGFPDAFLLGWWFDTLTECAAGKCPSDGAAGHFINQVVTHVPPPKQYAALAGLDADTWAELVNCARAVHARTLCDGQPYEPPTHYLSELARAQWPLFARLFTTGEARASPQRHYALQNAELLWVLAKDAFAVETDDWLAEKRAQHEPAERETS